MMRLFTDRERMTENKIAKEIHGGRVCGSKERQKQETTVGGNGGDPEKSRKVQNFKDQSKEMHIVDVHVK